MTTIANPVGWGTTVGVASGAAFPFNPSRTGLIFYNSSSGVAIAVCPAVVNVGSGGVYPGFQAGIAVINGAGSITMQPGDKFIIDNLSCTTAWNAIASGTGGTLTMYEFL